MPLPDPKTVCKFFQKYSKPYMGTLYSSPMPGHIQEATEQGMLAWGLTPEGNLAWTVLHTCSSRELRRRSFTGWQYTIPPGTQIAQYVARQPGVTPSFGAADVVYAYQDDHELIGFVQQAGYSLAAVKIAATSEIIGVYSRINIPPSHHPADVPSLLCMEPLDIDHQTVLREVRAITDYRDDYPYYNKNNSWAAASLRGFKPSDPLYGLKPTEMSRKWLAEHPEDAELRICQDTVLAESCPALMSTLGKFPYGAGFERVRLLRLGRGELTRHCDITDRDLGTRNGQLCRFHMPIITHPAVRSDVWDLEGHRHSIHLKAWNLYYMDIRKPHAASNPENRERIHLTFDVVSDERLRRAIQ